MFVFWAFVCVCTARTSCHAVAGSRWQVWQRDEDVVLIAGHGAQRRPIDDMRNSCVAAWVSLTVHEVFFWVAIAPRRATAAALALALAPNQTRMTDIV